MTTPSIRDRMLIALAVASVAAAIARFSVSATPTEAGLSDYFWFHHAGEAVIRGESPYTAIDSTGPYPRNAGYYYAAPSAIIAVPFASLPIQVGKVLWSAALAGVLAYAMTRDGYWRLPLLLSFPMLWCMASGQWAPLVLASVYLPSLGWLAACKPTLGAAAFAGLQDRRGLITFVVVTVVAFVLSLAVLPEWPRDYLRELRTSSATDYRVPILTPWVGPLIALAALRWRRPEARVVLALGCVPQGMMFYDQLPLAVVAQTFRQSLAMALASYAPIAAVALLPANASGERTSPWMPFVIVVMYFLPCVGMVLISRRRIS